VRVGKTCSRVKHAIPSPTPWREVRTRPNSFLPRARERRKKRDIDREKERNERERGRQNSNTTHTHTHTHMRFIIVPQFY
jgi:hypothetical protein